MPRTVVLFLLLATGCATKSPLAELLDRYESYGLSGAIVVADGERVLIDDAYGLADKERRIANTPETAFSVGSVGKTFTAAAILLLEQRGKLRVDDRIEAHLGAMPPDKQAITIRQLLTHTSGLQPNVWDAGVAREATREEMIAAVKASKLLFAPGARTRYSNTGFTLLAAIVERVSGEDYKTFIRREILAPAGLRQTGFAEDRLWQKVARGYAEPDDEVSGPQDPGPRSWGSHLGAGGFVSTARDLHRWLRLPHDPLGWWPEKTPLGRSIVYHDGHVPGFRSNAVRYTERPLLIAYALNDELVRMPVRDAVERVVFGDPYLLPLRRRDAPAIDPQRVVGTYALDGENRIRIWIDNGVLQAGAIGQRAIDLLLGTIDPSANEQTRAVLAKPEGEFAEWWRAQCADPAGARIAGTAPRSPVSMQTFVTCGGKTLRLVWRDGKLSAWGGGIEWAGIVPLRQHDATSFVAFENLLARKVTRLEFRDGTLVIDGVALR